MFGNIMPGGNEPERRRREVRARQDEAGDGLAAAAAASDAAVEEWAAWLAGGPGTAALRAEVQPILHAILFSSFSLDQSMRRSDRKRTKNA